MSLTLKLFALVTRTCAKPVANYLKQQAREHERFRKLAVSFAQQLHRVDMRMRLGLLQDPAAIDRQIKREAAEAEEKRLRAQQRPAPTTPTVKTEAEMRADEDAREREKKQIEDKLKAEGKKRSLRFIRPLSETRAIEMGANFISEAFVFGVAAGLLLFEAWRSKRKETTRREGVKDRLELLEDDVRLAREEKGMLEEQVGVLRGQVENLLAGQQGSGISGSIKSIGSIGSESSKEGTGSSRSDRRSDSDSKSDGRDANAKAEPTPEPTPESEPPKAHAPAAEAV